MAKVPESAIKYVETLNLKDLKRACIMRGLPFEEVGNKSVLNLQSWFLKNFDLPLDHKLLEEYDIWCEGMLKSRGVDPIMTSPTFRLSAIAERNADGEVTKRKRVKSLAPRIKKKKERTSDGLFKGTKKANTYELAQKGLPKAEVIRLIKERWPDAKEKSIGIWYNRAKKVNKNVNTSNKS